MLSGKTDDKENEIPQHINKVIIALEPVIPDEESCQNELEGKERSDQMEENFEHMEKGFGEEIQGPEEIDYIAKNRLPRDIQKPTRFNDTVTFSRL